MRRRYAVCIAAAAVAGVAIGVVVHAATTRAKLPPLDGQATWAPHQRPAPLFTLRDQHGTAVSLASLRGRTVALAFMNSLCGTTCPVEGQMLGAAIEQLPIATRPQLVVVSVNPKADSPITISGAIAHWRLPQDTTWLVGNRRDLARVWRGYNITVDKNATGIVHSTAIYLIDKRGDERAGFLVPFLPDLVAGDLRTLART